MMTFERLLELAQLGLFAVAGGVAKQCHRMLKGDEAFSLMRFVLHICLALYRDGIILMIGFTAQPLLDIFEIKFLSKAQEVIK